MPRKKIARPKRKTPLGNRYIKQVMRANDQVCFAAFQQWEFLRQLAPFTVSNPTDFTTGVYPANPFAETIHRRISELNGYAREAEEVSLQMGIIAGVEYVLAYLGEAQSLREGLIAETGDSIKHDAEEEQLRLRITRWLGKAPKADYFRTIGYLRLLRNHYAHVNDTPDPSFGTYMRSYGTPLNKFWANGITNIQGIDFRTLHNIDLTPHLTFGVMNLLRICIEHIDDMVAQAVSSVDAVRWIIRQIMSDTRNRGLSAKSLSRKVAERLRMEWNIEEPDSAAKWVDAVLADGL